MTQAATSGLPAPKVLPLTVSHQNLLADAQAAVLKLFPEWQAEDLDLFQCKDGITNKLVRCTNRKTNLAVLIRAYGKNSELLIDRNQEVTNIRVLSQLGLCPPLYGKFKNGLVYGYVPGEVVQVSQLSDPHISRLVAHRLAEWHRVTIPGAKTAKLFVTLNQWLGEVRAVYANPSTAETHDDPKLARFHTLFDLEALDQEMNFLRVALERINSPVVFSHNDLLSANVIYNAADDSTNFIDHEYASYNYRGFDIGNHFAEFAGFDCDYSLYPDRATQVGWLRNYLEAERRGKDSDQAAPVTEAEVDELYREVNKFYLASHIYWGFWAMVQASFSDIDFDYMGYARMRFDEYHRRRDELLAL
ncbi:hypothetical protein IWQ60_004415 [Tieghemiomyces parasiticus]|uniref:ethanolamine kinase n=1 Tax=Tieghemiomyces parasiticus TaxID=78921 RepID=A0A9W8DVJ5_9FUNG|nr:hypothetical protein IWQ60_004415 [Tieghemiomyces parasiticus]